jgi:hypothetical protein
MKAKVSTSLLNEQSLSFRLQWIALFLRKQGFFHGIHPASPTDRHSSLLRVNFLTLLSTNGWMIVLVIPSLGNIERVMLPHLSPYARTEGVKL